MSRLVRKQFHLDSTDVSELERIVQAKGGRTRGNSLSREVTIALREHIRRQKARQEEAAMTPVWERLLAEKFDNQEAWLRSGVWGGATYSTTAALLLLELLCGKTLDPKEAQQHFELIRGRAWKIVRRDVADLAAGTKLPPDS
ncbi:MAG TPA: hypothetical protein VGK74_13145 [Symbiobacteriaceae bacterium]